MSVLLYWLNGSSWLLFALLFLAPDLSLLGCAVGPRIGAAYNALHAYLLLPVILAALGLLGGSTFAVAVALIWSAHLLWPLPHGWRYPLPKAFLGRGVLEVCAVATQSEDQSPYRQ